MPCQEFRTAISKEELRLELVTTAVIRSERHDGVGLTGMRARAEEMGGELKIVSFRGKGTTVTAILPLNPELVL
jgi:signal transduction histidine kinase